MHCYFYCSVLGFGLNNCILLLLHSVSVFDRDFVSVLLPVHSWAQLPALDSHCFAVVWRIYPVQRTLEHVLGKINFFTQMT